MAEDPLPPEPPVVNRLRVLAEREIEQLAELRKDIRTLLADNDAQTLAEIREEKRKTEEQKKLEAEEEEAA